jgi:hypothetical protein
MDAVLVLLWLLSVCLTQSVTLCFMQKIKFSLCLINQVCGSGGTASPFLTSALVGDEWSASRLFTVHKVKVVSVLDKHTMPWRRMVGVDVYLHIFLKIMTQLQHEEYVYCLSNWSTCSLGVEDVVVMLFMAIPRARYEVPTIASTT